MSQQQDHPPYLLGLDLGVQSIGWAVIDLDEQGRPCQIRKTGVRCFDSGVGSETQIEMGKDESANAERRDARQQRRQLWRRARRRAAIFHILQRAHLLPEGSAHTPEQRHSLLEQLDRKLLAEGNLLGNRLDAHLLPYLLRKKALDSPLSPHELGKAFYHLAQRRGFLSNRKAKKSTEDEGVVKAAIGELEEAMHAAGARTLGEYLAGLDPEEERIRRRWTSREMYWREFDKIWSAQEPHHPNLTQSLRKQLWEALFYQRPLKSQKGLIGQCDLEPKQRRAPIACLEAQRFRFFQKLNDLQVTTPDGTPRPLHDTERAKLVEASETTGELPFRGRRGIRKLLGLTKPRGSEYGYDFNLERGGEKKIFGNRTAAKMAKTLGPRWGELPDSEQGRLVDEILSFQNEDALARRLVKAWGFDEATAAALAGLEFESGYAALSREAIRNLLPRLQQGQRFATARKEVYGEQLSATSVYQALPPVLDAVPALRNPVVTRALTELRKVINALVRQYGKPDVVRIELARDMKRGRRMREEASKRMRQNEKLREAAKKKIFEEMHVEHPRPGDVLKVLLAEECNWQCPYTGRSIEMTALIGPNPQFDVEHILPFSRSLDNSYMNKTLCYHEENRSVKQNRTPYEAYAGNPEKWHEILARVRRFRSTAAGSKLRKFHMTELPGDFAQRQLNDTRYISRLAADYVALLYGGRSDASGRLRVQVSTGGVTAHLRNLWGLNAILGDGPTKVRTDHRHHAVDAVVIALADPPTVRLLSQASQRASQLGHRLFAPVDRPWEGFGDQVAESVAAICVSYRVDRHVRGALHKDKLYSEPMKTINETGETIECRHIREPLKDMSLEKVNAIVDPRIRRAVQQKLEQLGGPPKTAFADAANHPYFRTRDGRIIPIHKARIRKAQATISLGEGARRRYAAPGKNHHMEIVARLDAQGNEKSWEPHVVTLFEAQRRLAHSRVEPSEPVVRRDHGAGKRFKFSLAGGEYVEMEHEAAKRQLFRVTVISGNEVEFRLHTDARPDKVLRKIGGRVRRTAASLFKAKARKVALDPLGNVLPAND